MKKILITPRINVFEKYNEVHTSLDLQWGTFANACGLILIPVIYTIPVSHYLREIEPDGILLTGGNDLLSIDPQPIHAIRENYELELINEAKRWNIPMIGVCKGAQLLAYHFGSSVEKIEGHVIPEHEVKSTTQISDMWSKIQKVNSYHNFGIKNLLSPLQSKLQANDSSSEAFQHESLNITGLLWHPERYHEPRNEDINIFKSIYNS